MVGKWGDVDKMVHIFIHKMKVSWDLSHHQHNNNKKGNCDITDVLINLTVVIVSQCVCILNHHVVHCKQSKTKLNKEVLAFLSLFKK